jgi:hypothetical protein
MLDDERVKYWPMKAKASLFSVFSGDLCARSSDAMLSKDGSRQTTGLSEQYRIAPGQVMRIRDLEVVAARDYILVYHVAYLVWKLK